jgi:hypothetical protein
MALEIAMDNEANSLSLSIQHRWRSPAARPRRTIIKISNFSAAIPMNINSSAASGQNEYHSLQFQEISVSAALGEAPRERAGTVREKSLSVEGTQNSSLLRNANEGLAFDLTPDQREILDQADRFGRKELYPLAERMDADEYWPEDAFPKIGEAGLFWRHSARAIWRPRF